ncbi:DUF7344 domain-containing protein [Natrialba sp. SSL1]|uniref:DUF7344 domain-containing protein n=1 Tax=Natrialba sp. SSL1 TaxID=1869245 RepID=UPI0008F8A916|nr:hypothetical protein [Natrialba sp. SSL1]OIB56516.1 hypothetical protein BBD46_18000 [Natrialba sp. SSL1]
MARKQSLTNDAAHTILSDPQRRHLLYLLKKNGKRTVDDLAYQIAAQEQDAHPETVSEEAYQRVAISLVHKHLPLLDDHNVIQYDQENQEVILMDVFDDLKGSFGERERTGKTSILQKLVPGY